MAASTYRDFYDQLYEVERTNQNKNRKRKIPGHKKPEPPRKRKTTETTPPAEEPASGDSGSNVPADTGSAPADTGSATQNPPAETTPEKTKPDKTKPATGDGTSEGNDYYEQKLEEHQRFLEYIQQQYAGQELPDEGTRFFKRETHRDKPKLKELGLGSFAGNSQAVAIHQQETERAHILQDTVEAETRREEAEKHASKEKQDHMESQQISYDIEDPTTRTHFWAVLADASYKRGFEARIQALQSVDPDLQYVGQYSDTYTLVAIDRKQNVLIVSNRGTQADINDLIADEDLVFGQTENNPRYQRAVQLYQTLTQQYPGYRIIETGHSLGGDIARVVAQTYDGEAHIFQPGTSLPQLLTQLESDKGTIHTYATRINLSPFDKKGHLQLPAADPISILGQIPGVIGGKNDLTIVDRQKTLSHQMDNFSNPQNVSEVRSADQRRDEELDEFYEGNVRKYGKDAADKLRKNTEALIPKPSKEVKNFLKIVKGLQKVGNLVELVGLFP